MTVDLKALQAKLEELKTGKKVDSEFLSKYVQLRDGENRIRLLPPKDSDSNFYAETAIHRINGKNLHCIGRARCPICKHVSKLYDSKLEENIEEARKIKSKKRYYFNAIVREDKDPTTGETLIDQGPKIFSCGIKLFEKILSTFVDPDYGDLTKLADGWDYKIVKKQIGEYPNYDDSAPRPKSTPAGTPEQCAEWLDNLHDLEALIVKKSPDELQEELDFYLSGGESDSYGSSRDDDETPKASTSKASKEEEGDPFGGGDSDGGDDEFLAELKKLRDK